MSETLVNDMNSIAEKVITMGARAVMAITDRIERFSTPEDMRIVVSAANILSIRLLQFSNLYFGLNGLSHDQEAIKGSTVSLLRDIHFILADDNRQARGSKKELPYQERLCLTEIASYLQQLGIPNSCDQKDEVPGKPLPVPESDRTGLLKATF